MGYSWYRTDSAYHRHPKMLALKAELNEPLADAYVSRLWSWTQTYAPSGRFPVTLADGLEAELGVTASRGTLLRALEKCGWLDRVGDHFEVHDWPEYQAFHAQKSKKDAAKKRQRRHRAKSAVTPSVTLPVTPLSRVTAPPTDGRTDVTNTTTTDLSLVLVEVEATPPAREVFEHWRKATGKARAVLDAKRRDLIDRRLAEGHLVEDLKAAIDGYTRSPWHQGENERRRKFLGLDLMLRDAAHIEAGLDLLMQHGAINGPPAASKFLTPEQRKDLYADAT